MLSLQLAKFDFIKLKKNLSPFLLLDDVFDKLDSGRIEKLLNLVSQENFKQVFITDASKERTIKFCTDFKIKHHLIDIQS